MTIMHEHAHCIAAYRLAAYDDIQMCHARFSRATKARYSNCPRGCPHLLAEPCVRWFLVQARVPGHEIWEWLDFSRRLDEAYAIDSPDKFCQLSRHSQDQVRFRNCEHCCRKEWNAEDNTPLRAKLSQRTVHGSLFARPGLDHHMGKL